MVPPSKDRRMALNTTGHRKWALRSRYLIL